MKWLMTFACEQHADEPDSAADEGKSTVPARIIPLLPALADVNGATEHWHPGGDPTFGFCYGNDKRAGHDSSQSDGSLWGSRSRLMLLPSDLETTISHDPCPRKRSAHDWHHHQA
jgi:hypothetical protein